MVERFIPARAGIGHTDVYDGVLLAGSSPLVRGSDVAE
ncbi:hypothetical protein HAL1_20310 [Halomonas sp. HAL1]|nr:hypothetical protein HAL1_20310 [Halomonas sp. HAL1]